MHTVHPSDPPGLNYNQRPHPQSNGTRPGELHQVSRYEKHNQLKNI